MLRLGLIKSKHRDIWVTEQLSSHLCEDTAPECPRDVGRLPPEARPGEAITCKGIEETKPLEICIFCAIREAVKRFLLMGNRSKFSAGAGVLLIISLSIHVEHLYPETTAFLLHTLVQASYRNCCNITEPTTAGTTTAPG